MPTALVVYESMYGSTRHVAEAVARGIGATFTTTVVEVGALAADGGLPAGVDLLVVGGPTHTFTMSRAETRSDAATKAPDGQVLSRTGIREWIDALDPLPRTPVATFATKVDKRWLPGSAARSAAKALRAKGAVPVAPGRDFWVLGTVEGLRDGELAAAQEWGTTLARSLQPA